MPTIDGWELLNRLRQSKAFAMIPLVIMSASKARFANAPTTIAPVTLVDKVALKDLLTEVADVCGAPSGPVRVPNRSGDG